MTATSVPSTAIAAASGAVCSTHGHAENSGTCAAAAPSSRSVAVLALPAVSQRAATLALMQVGGKDVRVAGSSRPHRLAPTTEPSSVRSSRIGPQQRSERWRGRLDTACVHEVCVYSWACARTAAGSASHYTPRHGDQIPPPSLRTAHNSSSAADNVPPCLPIPRLPALAKGKPQTERCPAFPHSRTSQW